MKRLIYNIISVVYSQVRFIIKSIIKYPNFKFVGIQRFSPNSEIIMEKGGRFVMGKRCRAHRRSKIVVGRKGKLKLGNSVILGNGVGVFCFENIEIGDYTELSADTKIYDHDHDFRVPGGLKERKFRTAPVKIGENTWIGCNVVILRGTTIGNNCVVGSGSVLKGNYPDNTIIVQKRETQVIDYAYKE